MICPNCGATVADGALRCPRCRFELGVTQKISLGKTTWCPSCGALVPEGAKACPKCGSSLAPERPVRATRDLKLPEIGNTSSMYALTEEQIRGNAEIESAIPSVEDGPGAVRDHMPRLKIFLVAALCALLFVGGGILAITHPWDPDASNISAKTPADTSKSGFPGKVDTLTGQDSTPEQGSGEPATNMADELKSLHEKLGSLSGRADELEAALAADGLTADKDTRTSKKQEMDQLSIEVSNLIGEVSDKAGTGEYEAAIKDLSTLGSWLRNRCDALSEAWRLSAESSDPASDKGKIEAAAEKGASFKRLFSQKYGSWSLTSES